MVDNKNMEELKEGWKRVKLGEVCEIVFSGGTPKTKISEYWEGNINWLSSGETRNRYIKRTEKTITKKGVENSSTKLALKNDVVVASAGQGFTRGQASYCLINTYINQSVISLRSNYKIIDSRYLFFNITSRYNELRHLSDGNASRGSLTTKIIKDLDISLPPLEIQEKIASILSALDDKIEINNEMNKTLEEMAQTLFKRWFIDFEFPNENGEPYKSSGGKMVESELGEIPEEWEVKEIQNIIEVKDGTHDSPKKNKSGYKLITSKHLEKNKINFESANIISKEDYTKINKRSQVNQYDILISMIGTIGNLYLVMEENINYAIKNIGLFKTSQNIKYYSYIYFYLKTELIENYIKSRLAGSGMATFF